MELGSETTSNGDVQRGSQLPTLRSYSESQLDVSASSAFIVIIIDTKSFVCGSRCHYYNTRFGCNVLL